MPSPVGAKSYSVGSEPVTGYRLVEFLGKGGFGTVWKAQGPGGVLCALKIIDLLGDQGAHEFRALKLIKEIPFDNHLVLVQAVWLKDHHGNILPDDAFDWQVTPVSAQEGTVAFTRPVELIIGMTLGTKCLFKRLREVKSEGGRGIPPEELLVYMDNAARGIDYLNNDCKIIHGDVKPANILVMGRGAALCDFGLARAVESLRKTSMAPMTLAYAAPESFRGKSKLGFTDQYCLAVSYYELRVGKLPFPDDSPVGDVIEAHTQGKLDLSELPELERDIIQRAVAVKPEDRWGSCVEMVDELREAYMRETGKRPGASPSLKKSFGRMMRKHGRKLTALTSILLLAGIGWLGYSLMPAPRPGLTKFLTEVETLMSQDDQQVGAAAGYDKALGMLTNPAEQPAEPDDQRQAENQQRDIEDARGKAYIRWTAHVEKDRQAIDELIQNSSFEEAQKRLLDFAQSLSHAKLNHERETVAPELFKKLVEGKTKAQIAEGKFVECYNELGKLESWQQMTGLLDLKVAPVVSTQRDAVLAAVVGKFENDVKPLTETTPDLVVKIKDVEAAMGATEQSLPVLRTHPKWRDVYAKFTGLKVGMGKEDPVAVVDDYLKDAKYYQLADYTKRVLGTNLPKAQRTQIEEKVKLCQQRWREAALKQFRDAHAPSNTQGARFSGLELADYECDNILRAFEGDPGTLLLKARIRGDLSFVGVHPITVAEIEKSLPASDKLDASQRTVRDALQLVLRLRTELEKANALPPTDVAKKVQVFTQVGDDIKGIQSKLTAAAGGEWKAADWEEGQLALLTRSAKDGLDQANIELNRIALNDFIAKTPHATEHMSQCDALLQKAPDQRLFRWKIITQQKNKDFAGALATIDAASKAKDAPVIELNARRLLAKLSDSKLPLKMEELSDYKKGEFLAVLDAPLPAELSAAIAAASKRTDLPVGAGAELDATTEAWIAKTLPTLAAGKDRDDLNAALSGIIARKNVAATLDNFKKFLADSAKLVNKPSYQEWSERGAQCEGILTLAASSNTPEVQQLAAFADLLKLECRLEKNEPVKFDEEKKRIQEKYGSREDGLQHVVAYLIARAEYNKGPLRDYAVVADSLVKAYQPRSVANKSFEIEQAKYRIDTSRRFLTEALENSIQQDGERVRDVWRAAWDSPLKKAAPMPGTENAAANKPVDEKLASEQFLTWFKMCEALDKVSPMPIKLLQGKTLVQWHRDRADAAALAELNAAARLSDAELGEMRLPILVAGFQAAQMSQPVDRSSVLSCAVRVLQSATADQSGISEFAAARYYKDMAKPCLDLLKMPGEADKADDAADLCVASIELLELFPKGDWGFEDKSQGVVDATLDICKRGLEYQAKADRRSRLFAEQANAKLKVFMDGKQSEKEFTIEEVLGDAYKSIEVNQADAHAHDVLAQALVERSQRVADYGHKVRDLRDAISHGEEAVKASTVRSRQRQFANINLGAAYLARGNFDSFTVRPGNRQQQIQQIRADFEEAINAANRAMQLAPGSVYQGACYQLMGNAQEDVAWLYGFLMGTNKDPAEQMAYFTQSLDSFTNQVFADRSTEALLNRARCIVKIVSNDTSIIGSNIDISKLTDPAPIDQRLQGADTATALKAALADLSEAIALSDEKSYDAYRWQGYAYKALAQKDPAVIKDAIASFQRSFELAAEQGHHDCELCFDDWLSALYVSYFPNNLSEFRAKTANLDALLPKSLSKNQQDAMRRRAGQYRAATLFNGQSFDTLTSKTILAVLPEYEDSVSVERASYGDLEMLLQRMELRSRLKLEMTLEMLEKTKKDSDKVMELLEAARQVAAPAAAKIGCECPIHKQPAVQAERAPVGDYYIQQRFRCRFWMCAGNVAAIAKTYDKNDPASVAKATEFATKALNEGHQAYTEVGISDQGLNVALLLGQVCMFKEVLGGVDPKLKKQALDTCDAVLTAIKGGLLTDDARKGALQRYRDAAG